MNRFLAFLRSRLYKGNPWDSTLIGWHIAPLVNAATRNEDTQYTELLFKSLVGEEYKDIGLQAGMAARGQQQKLVTNCLKKIKDNLIDDHNLCAAFVDNEYASFTGLIANRLMSQLNRPVMILRPVDAHNFSGSLRSPMPLLTQINETGLATAQGHEQACGIIIPKRNLPKLLMWSDKVIITDKKPRMCAAECSPKQIDLNFCEKLEAYATCWGGQIPEPQFAMQFRLSPEQVIVYQKTTYTIKFICNGVEYLLFKASAEEAEQFKKGGRLQAIVRLYVTQYNGVRTATGKILTYEFIDEADAVQDLW